MLPSLYINNFQTGTTSANPVNSVQNTLGLEGPGYWLVEEAGSFVEFMTE